VDNVTVLAGLKFRNWVIIAACVAVFSLSVNGQKVVVSSDPAVDYSSYRKYVILESKNPSLLKISHQAILDNLQLALATRGLLPVKEGETADLFVVYNAGIKEMKSKVLTCAVSRPKHGAVASSSSR
jgi:hypothetical protein